MKFKHFLVFTVVFVLVALGTSCSKTSEKKICGKWQLVSAQYHDSDDPEWDIDYPDPDEVWILELKKDNTYAYYENGVLEDTGSWMYDKSTENILIFGTSWIVKKCTSSETVWDYKYAWNGDTWEEVQWNFKKVK